MIQDHTILSPYIWDVLVVAAETMSFKVAPSDKYELLRKPWLAGRRERERERERVRASVRQ